MWICPPPIIWTLVRTEGSDSEVPHNSHRVRKRGEKQVHPDLAYSDHPIQRKLIPLLRFGQTGTPLFTFAVGVLVQRLLRCGRVTEDALRFAFRRRDLTGAEQVHGDISVEIVQLAEFQHPCFLDQNVRPSFFTIRNLISGLLTYFVYLCHKSQLNVQQDQHRSQAIISVTTFP